MTYQQPAYGAPPTPPQTYLAWSILNMIFCCLIFGIVGLVFSVQTQSAINSGRMAEAHELSQKARTWNLVATISGAVIAVVVFIVVIAGSQHRTGP